MGILAARPTVSGWRKCQLTIIIHVNRDTQSFCRKEPPTDEEVRKNFVIMQTTKINAAKLDEIYPPEKDQSITGSGNFPVYNEYEKAAGLPNKKEEPYFKLPK